MHLDSMSFMTNDKAVLIYILDTLCSLNVNSEHKYEISPYHHPQTKNTRLFLGYSE